MTSIEVIFGPTASGKSALALDRARMDARIQIVNADASLIYKGFDIGTAKPSIKEQQEVPHYLLDICDPNEQFNVAEYMRLGQGTIRAIIEKGNIPLVVGGSGLYIAALFNGLPSIEVEASKLKQARAEYEKRFEQFGFEGMLKQLEQMDPVLFTQITREQNPRRLQRAWEYHLATGRSLGNDRNIKCGQFEYPPIYTLLKPSISDLRKKILLRVDSMLEAGWLEEVKSLKSRGIGIEYPAMKAIGYKSLFNVLEGLYSIDRAREEIILRTGQYAKRQVTWMNKFLSQQ